MSKELDEALKRSLVFPDLSKVKKPYYRRTLFARDFNLSKKLPNQNKFQVADHNHLISPYIATGLSNCMHTDIKTYVGFSESYQYCVRCDKKNPES